MQGARYIRQHRPTDEVCSRSSPADNLSAEQIYNLTERADLVPAVNDANIPTPKMPRTSKLCLKRFVSLFAVALSQILIYLAESGNSNFYLSLALITLGSLAIRKSSEAYYQILVFLPFIFLTGVISRNALTHQDIAVLSQEEIEKWIAKPRAAKNYIRGNAEVLAVTRGRTAGSKQVVLKFNNSKLLVTFPDLPWAPSSSVTVGTKITGTFEIYPLPNSPLPWSYEAHLERSGISVIGKSIKYEILHPTNYADGVESFISKVTSDLGASYGLDLINASLLGRGEVLAKDQDELFKRTSTTHLIVVSGFHVGILSRLSEVVILWAVRFYPKIFLFVVAELIGPLFGLAVALLYGHIIGFSLTVVRALVALAIVTIGKILFRKANNFSVLGVAFILIQTIWPGSAFEPGCQLTFGALLGLVLSDMALKGIQSWVLPVDSLEAQLRGRDWRVKRFFFEKLFQPLFTCAIVGLTVAPITLIWFQKFVPLSPVINAILIPIFTAFVLILGGIALFIYKLLGLIFPLKLAIFSSEKVINIIQSLEKFSISVGLGPIEVSRVAAAGLALAHLFLLIAAVRFFINISRDQLRSS